MLRTPATFADIARVGPIASQSERVREWLERPARTGLRRRRAARPSCRCPRRSTSAAGCARAIGRRLETIVVNGVLPDRFTADEVALVASAAGRRKRPRAVVREIRRPTGGRTCQHEHLDRLEAEADAPVHALPFLFTDALSPDDVSGLASVLAPALS